MTSITGESSTRTDPGSKKRPARTKKPNYGLIHKDPLPLAVTPLPPLIPHNPISLLHILFAYLFPSKSSYTHSTLLYTAKFSLATRSVNVTDMTSIQGLWCRGFFGKGSLSRSEPTWLTRTKRRLGAIGPNESLTAEEVTERRRVERREFKKERAKKEKEKLERILADEGKIVLGPASDGVDGTLPKETEVSPEGNSEAGETSSLSPPEPLRASTNARFAPEPKSRHTVTGAQQPVIAIEDLEHLQLTLEEAFFLSYGLGVLTITNEKDGRELSNPELLTLFRACSYFPPAKFSDLQPDDPFLVNYVVYHHFRSLGWVVKTGVKFSVDYLLYNRGPAFSHAEFAVVVLPSYSHPHWTSHIQRITKDRPSWH